MDGVEDIDNGNFFLNALITVLPFSRETENSGNKSNTQKSRTNEKREHRHKGESRQLKKSYLLFFEKKKTKSLRL